MPMDVSAAGALLWMTHTLLQKHRWDPQGPESDRSRLNPIESFAGDVNLLEAQRYKVSKTAEESVEIHVRALLVGSKLFVHFVSSGKSVRLSLKVAEFVKPSGRKKHEDGVHGVVLYIEKWRCNLEILRWRLERNLFPEFSSESSLVASDAELSRLPEPLLVRVGGFLSVSDFCRVTGTSKYLHQLQESSELWQQFLRRDYPTFSFSGGGDPRAEYVTHWGYAKRMEVLSQHLHGQHLREIMLRQQAPWRWRGGGRLPAPPLHLPVPPPFQPFGDGPWSLRAPPHPGILGDDDLDMLRDPFAFYLNPSYFY
ncbi:hypothetical protein KRP22_006966 [Phytophthora ramorum]|nr:hypothetical protein KRP22_1937 [Phytophthora ramorum]